MGAETAVEKGDLLGEILGVVGEDEERTTLSVAALVEANIRRRRALFAALDRLFREAHGYVAAVETSEAMATLGYRTSAERRKRLRRYYKVGGRGAYVSHVSIHRGASGRLLLAEGGPWAAGAAEGTMRGR